MEVDELQKDEPTTAVIANVDPQDGFERSKMEESEVKPSDNTAPAKEATTAAGGFMREVDVQQEERERANEGEAQPTQQPSDAQTHDSGSLWSSSPSKNTSSKSKNSLNLVLSPAGSDKTAEDRKTNEQIRKANSSSDDRGNLQLPRSDPPPTPPTRLASSNIKRRSSRSPNSAASSSPFSASTALQNAVTSSPSPTPSTSKIEASPSVAASTSAASSSSMKRSPSSPGGSPTNLPGSDVFGSSTPNKRLRSASPSSSPKLDGSSSPIQQKTLHVVNATTHDTGSSSATSNNTPPSPSSSPLSDSDRASSSKSATADSSSSPPSASSSSPAADDSEEGPQPRRAPIPRRVKVYALHESNWIDLGTGSCTWHRSVIRRSRRANIGQGNATSDEAPKVPQSPPPMRKELTILGRASRDAARQEEPEEEIVEELVDLEDNCYLDEDEDEAAWIEVVKEGRWKNDAKPAKARQRAEAKDNGDGAESPPKAEESGNPKSDGDDDDEWERVWTTRIEKPELTASGFEVDSFFVQPGLEEGEEVIGRYRRQQDTLIVWKSSVSDTELALSFAATAGCLEIWEFLKEIHMRWEVQLAFREREAIQETEDSQVTHHIPSTPQEVPKNGLGLDLSRFSQMSLLQDPALGNLVDLEKTIKMVARTALGREKLSTFVGRSGFIQKLIPVFKEAEDLESLSDLHTLCVLMHDILNLNDHGLWELILNDDIFFDVISILEYDPAFPNMKAAYRAHLSDPSLFVEVVPISDDSIKSKIHQIYRLQYIKDVILPRVLDDNAFQIVNSIIYFHQVDIVQYLSKRDEFWKEIFEGTFPDQKVNGAVDSKEQKEPTANGAEHAEDHEAKQQDAIAFLQSFAQMVKQLQISMRTQHFRALSERGMLRVLEYALLNTRLHDVQPIRIAVVEILMLLVDNDPSSIRSFVLKEHERPGKQQTLMTAIISAFHKEEDLGVKAQLAEAIRVLLLPPGEAAATETAAARTRPDDPNADSFLQYFYENGVATLLEPLTKGLDAPMDGTLLELPITKIALYTHLCELLCFFVVNHSFRSKFFILSSSVTSKITRLLRARPKHIRLAALRYFRACVGRNDDFYNRYLVKNGMIPAILQLTKQETSNDNLLASACLELFEYLRLNPSSRIILNDLMSNHEDEVKALSTGLPVFQGLLAKWEQLNEPPPPVENTSSEADTVADLSKDQLDAPIAPGHRDDRALTAEEEDYFNADDDEEDSQVPNGHNFQPSVPLKRPDSSDNEGSAQGDPLRRKRQKLGLSNSENGSSSELLTHASAVPSEQVADSVDLLELEGQHEEELARIREKRKRAEDEEDDTDFLAAKKATQEKDKENAKVGLPASKTKNVSGKLKLFFGKKP